MNDEGGVSQQNYNLVPCGNCGRTFNPEALARHENICKKTSNQRKLFNSSKQRSLSGLPNTVSARKQPLPAPKQPQPRKSDWRQKHEDFIQTIRAARGVTLALKTGKELPPPPPPTINPDYIQCPHCSRRFGENAAERHINFCADQHKRLETRNKSKSSLSLKAAEKQGRRTSYRPPLPSSGIRRTSNSPSSGNTNFNRQTSQPQHTPVKAKSADSGYGHTKSGANRTRDRYDDNKPFNTRLPSNSVATTKTGLKARLSNKDSSNGFETVDFNTDSSRNKTGKLLHTSSGYTPSTSSRVRNGYHHNDSFNNDKQSMNRKVSNLQERKRAGLKESNATIYSPDFIAAWDSQSHQDGRWTFGKEHDDFHHGYGDPTNNGGQGSVPSTDGLSKTGGKSRFCHECGTRYPIVAAKFCCECGIRRITV